MLPNKREWGDLGAMVKAINSRLASYHPSTSSGTLFRVMAQVFDWSEFNTMQTQLEVLRDVDNYVSSVGTALTLQYFLPDTSVVINVGHEDGFWEEHLVAANRHLAGIYPSTVKAIRSEDEIVELVSQAVEKIASDFSIPVPRGSSLSKYGSVFSTFCVLRKATRYISCRRSIISTSWTTHPDLDRTGAIGLWVILQAPVATSIRARGPIHGAIPKLRARMGKTI